MRSTVISNIDFPYDAEAKSAAETSPQTSTQARTR
jgi:hypothetical protein